MRGPSWTRSRPRSSGHPRHECGRCASPPIRSARYLASQRCTVHRCTPARAATSLTSAPANTARDGSKRCSTTDKTTSANPLPGSGTSHRDARSQSAEHGPYRTSPDRAQAAFQAPHENFPYSLKCCRYSSASRVLHVLLATNLLMSPCPRWTGLGERPTGLAS